jgi:hypothetical protein
MAHYHEIRVRPVVRYVVTEYQSDEDDRSVSSAALGEFDSVEFANRTAEALAWAIYCTRLGCNVVLRSHPAPPDEGPGRPVVVPARALKIDWTRAPGAPQDAIEWHLHEVYPRGTSRTPMTLELANAVLAAMGKAKRLLRPSSVAERLIHAKDPGVIMVDPGEAGLWAALAALGVSVSMEDSAGPLPSAL